MDCYLDFSGIFVDNKRLEKQTLQALRFSIFFKIFFGMYDFLKKMGLLEQYVPITRLNLTTLGKILISETLEPNVSCRL